MDSFEQLALSQLPLQIIAAVWVDYNIGRSIQAWTLEEPLLFSSLG